MLSHSRAQSHTALFTHSGQFETQPTTRLWSDGGNWSTKRETMKHREKTCHQLSRAPLQLLIFGQLCVTICVGNTVFVPQWLMFQKRLALNSLKSWTEECRYYWWMHETSTFHKPRIHAYFVTPLLYNLSSLHFTTHSFFVLGWVRVLDLLLRPMVSQILLLHTRLHTFYPKKRCSEEALAVFMASLFGRLTGSYSSRAGWLLKEKEERNQTAPTLKA